VLQSEATGEEIQSHGTYLNIAYNTGHVLNMTFWKVCIALIHPFGDHVF
jgi:hypothetical protein